jgi:hypothetical protein
LKYKYAPFVKKKYVVNSSELEELQFIEKQFFSSPLLAKRVKTTEKL